VDRFSVLTEIYISDYHAYRDGEVITVGGRFTRAGDVTDEFSSGSHGLWRDVPFAAVTSDRAYVGSLILNTEYIFGFSMDGTRSSEFSIGVQSRSSEQPKFEPYRYIYNGMLESRILDDSWYCICRFSHCFQIIITVQADRYLSVNGGLTNITLGRSIIAVFMISMLTIIHMLIS